MPVDGGREPGGRCAGSRNAVCVGCRCGSQRHSPCYPSSCKQRTLTLSSTVHVPSDRSRRARNRVNYAFADYDESLRSGGLKVPAPFAAGANLGVVRGMHQLSVPHLCSGGSGIGEAGQLSSWHGPQLMPSARLSLAPAALRQRSEDDSDDEGGRRRRRVSARAPPFAPCACLLPSGCDSGQSPAGPAPCPCAGH